MLEKIVRVDVLKISYVSIHSFTIISISSSNYLKDGAYFCYCAYVLHTSRYSGFAWVVPTNIGMFLCISLKLFGESRT